MHRDPFGCQRGDKGRHRARLMGMIIGGFQGVANQK